MENARRPRRNFSLPPRGMTLATVFGPIIGPVGSIIGLPTVVRCVKIGIGTVSVNTLGGHMSPAVSLVAAVASLLLWIVLAFVVAVPSGVVHLLLAAGVVFLVRWFALAY